MYLTLAGLAVVSLGIAAHGASLSFMPPVVWNAALGFGAGCAVAGALRYGTSRGGTAVKKRHTSPEMAIPTAPCPNCQRPVLAGLKACPFCNPIFAPGSPVDETQGARDDAVPQPVAMPGLGVTEKLREAAKAHGYLYVFHGDSKGQTLLLNTNAVTVGRGLDSTFILRDSHVSEQHVEIQPTWGKRLFLRDLGSRNGTYVNDERVDRAVLCSGDIVRVGRTLIYVGLD